MRHLSVEVMKKLVSFFILSRLDCCNSLVTGLPESKLYHLQGVQTNAACLVLGRQGRDHAKPLLRSLHCCQSKLRLSTRFPPCAIVAQIHVFLPTCLIFSLSVNPHILQMLVSRLPHTSGSTNMESVLSHRYIHDQWPGIASPKTMCLKTFFLYFKINPHTDSLTHHNVGQSEWFPLQARVYVWSVYKCNCLITSCLTFYCLRLFE